MKASAFAIAVLAIVVLRTSSREWAAQAVRALGDLRCAPSAHPRQVRVPLSFRID